MTTPKALAAAMQRRDADSILLREMQQVLRAELEKPPETQNLDTVDELTAAICELCGLEQAVAAHSCTGLETFRENITPQIAATTAESTTEPTSEPITVSVRPKQKLGWKRFAAIAASFAGALLIGNFATKWALGDSLLSTGARLMHEGIVFSMSEPETVPESLPDGQPDPYGIQAECNALGFTALTPKFIPDDLTDVSFCPEYTPDLQDLTFRFANESEERILSMHYMHYWDESMCPDIGIPTQSYEMTERVINGITVYQVTEDEFCTVTFRYNNVNYVIDFANLNADECEAILNSLFEDNANL